MNTQEEAKNFVKAYQEFSKSNETDVYFNLYKSKIDRITNTYYKKYNQFSETASLSSGKNPKFKNYNDFNVVPQVNDSRKYNTYNNFNQVPIQQFPIPQNKFIQYNNFDVQNNNINNNNNNNNNNQINQINQNIPNIVTKDDAGDYIFEIVEKIYKEQAGKITGMIIEFGLDKLKNMIYNDRKELMNQIENAHKLLQNIDK